MYHQIVQASPLRSILTDPQHLALFILFDITIVAFIGMIIWTLINRSRIGLQYRRPVNIGLAVALVSCLTYALILFKFLIGYRQTITAAGFGWLPQLTALTEVPVRYIEWAVTVPLLVIELIAVSTLTGRRMHNMRNIGVLAGFIMIFLGYIGGWAIDNGRNPAALIGCGVASGAFFVVVYWIVVYAVRKSIPELSRSAGHTLNAALSVLMIVWFVYPVTYFLGLLPNSGNLTVGINVAICAADIISKIGFGLLVQRVARQRTDEETEAELQDLAVDYASGEPSNG